MSMQNTRSVMYQAVQHTMSCGRACVCVQCSEANAGYYPIPRVLLGLPCPPSMIGRHKSWMISHWNYVLGLYPTLKNVIWRERPLNKNVSKSVVDFHWEINMGFSPADKVKIYFWWYFLWCWRTPVDDGISPVVVISVPMQNTMAVLNSWDSQISNIAI